MPHPFDQHGAFADLDPLVQGRLVVIVEDRDGHLGKNGAGVDAFVHNKKCRSGDLHPVGEGVAGSVHTRECRQQRRMGVDGAAAEHSEECRPGEFHEPGEDHEPGFEGCDLFGQGDVPRGAIGEVRRRQDKRLDAVAFGACQAFDAGTVRAHRDDGRSVGRIGRSVNQRLEICAGAGDEDDESGCCGHGLHDSAPSACS